MSDESSNTAVEIIEEGRLIICEMNMDDLLLKVEIEGNFLSSNIVASDLLMIRKNTA